MTIVPGDAGSASNGKTETTWVFGLGLGVHVNPATFTPTDAATKPPAGTLDASTLARVPPAEVSRVIHGVWHTASEISKVVDSPETMIGLVASSV